MNLLLVATKAPWPPIDGGRLLLLNTLKALAASGCRVTLVAPVDPSQFDLDRVASELAEVCNPVLVPAAPSWSVGTFVRTLQEGMPLSIARHALPAVRREVKRLLETERFDLVHAEQLQALPQALDLGVPVVLRAQNVESDLWRAAAERTRGLRRHLLRIEGKRLARWEGAAVRRAAATLALTAEDATRLRELAGPAGNVRVVRAPVSSLPSGTGKFPGNPAVVVFGSRGWLPNEDSAAWFVSEVWPAVRAELPEAVLHLFGVEEQGRTRMGTDGQGVTVHPPPRDSGEAFAPGSILAVPLRIASGVRMKVLEAWARGVPVVGTPAALAGLEVIDGKAALVAQDPRGFAAAVSRLHRDPALAASLVEDGRGALHERHDPLEIARRMMAEYAFVARDSNRLGSRAEG